MRPETTTRSVLFLYISMLLAGACALWAWNYGLWDLEGPDEGRYVQVAKELLGRSNWLLLTVNGEPYDQKPPLPFWILAGMLRLSGGEVSAWAMRLPSVLAGIAAVLLVFDIGRARWGARAGFLSGLILLTAPLFARQTATARLDVMFTAWITLSAWAWLSAPASQMNSRLSPGRLGVFWLGLAGAFFTKGPLALIAVLGMLLGESWRSRSWSAWRSTRPLIGLPLVLALIGSWLWSQDVLAGERFVEHQLATGTIERLLEGAHESPPWYYALTLFEDVFYPWLFFLAPGLVYFWRNRREGLPEGTRPLIFWILPTLLVLHVATGKRTQYLLPILPAMALLTGWFIDRHFMDRALPAWAYRLTWVGIGLLTLLLGGAIAVLVQYQARLWEQDFLVVTEHVVIAGIILIVFLLASLPLAWRRTPGAIIGVLALMTMSVEIFYAGVVNTARNQRRSSYAFSSTVDGLLLPGESEVGAVGKADRSRYHVYGHYTVRPVSSKGSDFATRTDLPRLLVARVQDEEELGEVKASGRFETITGMEADGEELVLLGEKAPESGVRARAGLPLRFSMLGDTGVKYPDQQKVVEQMLAVHRERPLEAVILLGDNLYEEDPFPLSFQQRFLQPFAPLIREQVPFYACLGNHDVKPRDKFEGELNSPLLHMEGRRYYSQTFGDDLITFFFLDTETLSDEPEQVDWFKKAVAASTSRWKVLALHKPLLATDISHGGDEDSYVALQKTLEGPEGIDLVLSGHNHLYERRHAVRGVVHVTAGAGGKIEDEGPLPEDSGRAAGYLDALSFAWMDVSPESIQLHALNENGEKIDEHEILPRAERSAMRPESREMNGAQGAREPVAEAA